MKKKASRDRVADDIALQGNTHFLDHGFHADPIKKVSKCDR